MTCDPKALMSAAACYQCVPKQVWQSSVISMLCYWANHLTPRFSYEPETELIQWTDSGGVHLGDLAAFYATPTWPSTSAIDSTFTSITTFHNLSSLVSLTALLANNGHLVGILDCSNCVSLVTIDCTTQNGLLTGVNVTGCVSLSNVQCSVNAGLDTLILTGCLAIAYLDCSFCGFTSLDVSGRILLTDLICNDNQLGTLDITGCFAIVNLFAFNNPALVVVGP